jgi:diadenosine tetraphosphate (Ap4A) HIT family hydrolase
MLAPGCVSCEILAGRRTVPGGVIYEDDYWHVDSVVSPVYWPGFLIIKLKRHCEHLAELSADEAATLGPVVQSTCAALTRVLEPAKIYICSFGDGIKHVHFWVLPRPAEMRTGMHWVMLHLDVRGMLTRRFGWRRWLVDDTKVARIAREVRTLMDRQLGTGG